MDCSTPGLPVLYHVPELVQFVSIESVMPSNHLILCHPLLLLPSVLRSIRVFSNESALCIRWPKYWSFSISSSNEYSGLISFRIDWSDLVAVRDSQESSPTPQFKNTTINYNHHKLEFFISCPHEDISETRLHTWSGVLVLFFASMIRIGEKKLPPITFPFQIFPQNDNISS